jgi:hypothetical protein
LISFIDQQNADHKKWQVHNSTKYPPLWGGTATLLPNNQVFVFGGKDDKGIDQNVAYLFDLGTLKSNNFVSFISLSLLN